MFNNKGETATAAAAAVVELNQFEYVANAQRMYKSCRHRAMKPSNETHDEEKKTCRNIFDQNETNKK